MGGWIRGWISRFSGALIFRPEGPNPLKRNILRPLDWKSGPPKSAKSNHDGSNPPTVFSADLKPQEGKEGVVGNLVASWMFTKRMSKVSREMSGSFHFSTTLEQCQMTKQGRALYGPIPVKTETFRALWAPLVHTNFGGSSYGPIIGPYLFLRKFVWTNGPESSSKVSPYTGIGPWIALPSLGIFWGYF